MSAGWFDDGAVPAGWFDETTQPAGWFDGDLLAEESGAPVDQPQGSDWNWDESLPTDIFVNGYQNSDAEVLTQAYGDEWNWEESLDDEWPTDQQLQPVVIVAGQPQDTVWDWDEVLSPEIISGGYQQADNAPAVDPIQHTDDVWDWDEHADDQWGVDESPTVPVAAASPIQHTSAEWDWDEVLSPEIVINGYQQSDNTPAPSPDQVFDTGWEFEAVTDEDGWSNHFTNYDPIVIDPIQHTHSEWDWDEVLYSDIITSGYQQADNAVVTNSDQQPQTDWDFDSDFGGEGGWNNHYTAYDPETQTFDDPWDWDESCEYEWQDESGPVVANNTPVVSPVQHTNVDWEWGDDGDDSILELIEYSPVGDDYVPPVPDVTDTHDGFWRKEYAKMFAHKPKLAEVVEIIQENPKEAIAVVREMPELKAIVYERYPDIDYSKVINDARIALFIAQNLLNAIELQRIQDEEDDLLIMLLLSL